MLPRTAQALSLVVVATIATACTTTKRVIFVTSSTIGMDVDSKPSSASIGYERIEGYVGPRYQDGSVPPVVASIATGGTVFSPKIAQVYATGAAAENALNAATLASEPNKFSGQPDSGQLIFFGTTTTLGFRVGFDGSVPDSATFGYKRKEFAVLPLGTSKVADPGDPLPSVLASINTAVASGSLNGVGLTAQQFFATGSAADALAETSTIRQELALIGKNAVATSLTAAQQKQAQQKADEQQSQLTTRLAAVLQYVAPGGTVDTQKLSALVDKANAGAGESTPVPISLKQQTTVDAIKGKLSDQQAAVNHLYEALPPAAQHGASR